MKKQYSLISLTKRPNDNNISTNRLRKSVTFAELAIEESKDNLSYRDDKMQKCEFNENKNKPKNKAYNKLLRKDQQNKFIAKNKTTSKSNNDVLSNRAFNLKNRPNFSKNIIKQYTPNSLKADSDQNSNKKLNNKSKRGSTKQNKADNVRKRENSKDLKYDLESSQEIYTEINSLYGDSKCGYQNESKDLSENEKLNKKLIEVEMENEYYTSQLANLQKYVQQLEKQIILQNRKNKDETKIIEEAHKTNNKANNNEIKNISLFKSKELGLIKDENKNLRNYIKKMSTEIESLSKIHNKILKDQIEASYNINESNASKIFIKENKQLKDAIYYMGSEIKKLRSYEKLNMALMEEIENHITNQNNLLEQNEKLQSHIQMLEIKIKEGHGTTLCEHKKQYMNNESSLTQFDCETGNVDKSQKSIKESKFYVDENLRITELSEENFASSNLIESELQDLDNEEFSLNYANCLYNSINNDIKLEDSNIFENLVQEKTLKSTNVTNDGENTDRDGLIKRSLPFDYSNSSENRSTGRICEDTNTTLKSIVTFGKRD